MSNLIVLAGIPGSGKSTWARTFFDLKYSIVSSDVIRKHLAGSIKQAHEKEVKPWDRFYSEVEQKLIHGVDVIADATFLTRRHRKRAIECARTANAKVHLVIFKNVSDATNRNLLREEDEQVPEDVMDDMVRLYWDMLAEHIQEDFDTVTKIERFL